MSQLQRRIFEPEHELFRQTCRRFLDENIVPHSDRWREAGIVDREAWKKAGEAGLLCMWADEKYGGAGMTDFRFDQIFIEEMAKGGDSGFFASLHNRIVGPYINHLGNDAQKEKWLPGAVSGDVILAVAMTEPGAGSDVAGMRTKAEDCGDYWLINGSKTYISNGINCDLVVVAARTNPDKPYEMGLFLVEPDMEGFARGRNLKKMGLKSQDTAELFFEDVRVPKDAILGEPGKGFYYLMEFLAEERLTGAVGYLAGAQSAFNITMEFVKERRAFGKPIGAFQNTRFKMAEMRAKLDMAQAFVDHCVQSHLDGQLTAEIAAEAKLLTSELQGEVVDECVQLHGGAGYMDEYKISRMYVDARISRIYAGTSEIMKEIIGRGLGLDQRKMN